MLQKYHALALLIIFGCYLSCQKKKNPIHYLSLNLCSGNGELECLQVYGNEMFIEMVWALYIFPEHSRVREIHYLGRPAYMTVNCIIGCINWLTKKREIHTLFIKLWNKFWFDIPCSNTFLLVVLQSWLLSLHFLLSRTRFCPRVQKDKCGGVW